jgi:hypothetical protein
MEAMIDDLAAAPGRSPSASRCSARARARPAMRSGLIET